MAVDVSKHLEKAKKYLERNKLIEAAEAYQAAVNDSPSNQEALQGLGDLYTHLGHPDRAATAYGLLFDRLCELRDENKALALYSRALRSTQQPPERMARFALLLQKAGRTADAIENYSAASELLLARGKQEPALECLERMAQLEPDSAPRQFAAGSLAEQLGKTGVAVRSYLRAAQLSEASGDAEAALELLKRAHRLAPNERSPALLYAQSLLRRGDAPTALTLLEPHAKTESDAVFLHTLSEALIGSGQLDRAREVLERMLANDPAIMSRLIDLANLYLQGGQEPHAISVLDGLQVWSRKARRDGEFASAIEGLSDMYPRSAPVVEFCAAAYAGLNREAAYFGALVRLFDIYIGSGNVERAGDVLDKLVEIDPYDPGNQSRMERLEGSADAKLMDRIRARIAQVATHAAPASSMPDTPREVPAEPTGERPGLDDLIVQAEIFLQYALQGKAVEKLQEIARLYPGAEERNQRIRSLHQMAGWWPESRNESVIPAAPIVQAEAASATEGEDTLRDLAKISEISQVLHRQPSAKAILATAIQEVGQYMRATRCFGAIGVTGSPPQLASEYCAPGVRPASGALLARLLTQVEQASAEGLGGKPLHQDVAPLLADLGLDSALGVLILDPETKAQAGVMIAAYSAAHAWRAHEKYFLQAVGDQMLLGVHHTRLRTMARALGAADEKTGLLARSSYLDCLVQETQRAKSQNSTLTLALFQLDSGADLARKHGESAMEHYVEQLAKTLQQVTRQTDLAIKYTAWSIAFIFPDTAQSIGEHLAEKIRQAGAAVRPPWDGSIGLSASVTEALARPDYESEDIVTELINRADAGLDEARRRGGSALVSLGAPA